MTDSKAKMPATKPPYAVAKMRRPSGACYCDHDDEECYRRGHWAPTSPMFERGGEWYIIVKGNYVKLTDLAPTLERDAVKDPAHVAARRRHVIPDPEAADEWPDNALDSF